MSFLAIVEVGPKAWMRVIAAAGWLLAFGSAVASARRMSEIRQVRERVIATIRPDATVEA
jgi:hypothetical protein